MALSVALRLSRPITVLIVTGLLASGCAGQSNLADDVILLSKSSDGLTPPAAALLDEAKARAKTRATGAGLGALTGLAVGVLAATSTRDDRARAALIGGGLASGTALGYAAGAYIDARNAQAFNSQAKLNGMINAAQQDAARYERDRLMAQAAIDQSEREIARLNAQRAVGQATADAHQRQAKSLDATAAALRTMARESGDNIATMERDIMALRRSGQDTSLLDEQRASLQAEHEGLAVQYHRLVAVVDTVPAPERPVIAANLP